MAGEVSTRALELPFQYLRKKGIPVEPLVEGFSLPAKSFFDKSARIDWPDFVAVCRRIGVAVGGLQNLPQIGQEIASTNVYRPLQIVMRAIPLLPTMYRWIAGRGSRSMFSNLEMSVEMVDAGLTFRIWHELKYEVSEEYFLITKGVLEATPSVLGYAPASVTMSRSGPSATYNIVLPARKRLRDRFVRILRVLRLNPAAAAVEIEKSYEMLEKQYRELQASTLLVERQSKQIQTVEELGRTLTRQIEPEQVAEAVLELLTQKVGFAHVAYFTLRPESTELAAAISNFDREDVVTADELRKPNPAAIRTRFLSTHPTHRLEFLQSPEEGLLGLIVGEPQPDRAPDLALLQGLIPHLTIAAKQSLAFGTIRAMNRDLEQRVALRTSELSKAKGELEVALDRANELDRLKSEFFDNINHELRTPLSLVLLSLEYALQMPDIPPAVRAYLETMDRAGDRLLRLINRLLDLAKLEAGKTKLKYEPVDLKAFFEAMLPPFRVLADSKDIQLTLESDSHSLVQVDVSMLEGIFQNLLGNALKFTNQGSVAIRVRESDKFVEVELADTGVGIPKQDVGRIFDRFAQSDSAGVRRFEGSGIGLALAKEGVEIHGGQIEVESEEGRGSTFRVRIPKGTAHIREELRDTAEVPLRPQRRDDPFQAPQHAGFAEQSALVAPSVPALPPIPNKIDPALRRRILLVEDDEETRRFLAAILRQHYVVVEAANGRLGLEAMRAEKPVVVISDVMMPEMSGLQMVQAAKADPELQEIPIILLTARREVDATLDGFQVGANDYLGKPFSPRELLARIDVQIRLRETSARLAESERFAALAILTSGFAHEVRNPLNGLLNALQPLHEMATAEGSTDTELLKLAIDCGERIQGLANSLLSFARPVHDRVAVALPYLLDNALDVVAWKLPPGVTVIRDYQFRDAVPAEPGSLGQVLLNLIDNAILSMPKSGELKLATEQVGDQIRITIQDTGGGIRPEHLERIFEPFFSTRPAGEGTGLGLAISRRIVDHHRGRIEVESKLGAGTRFELYLPVKPASVNERLPVDRTSLVARA